MKLISLFLFFLSIFTSPLYAAKEFVVGVGDYDYWPHHGVVGKEYKGYAREVLDLFASKSGYNFIYRPLPWKRVIYEYTRGNMDFIFPDNPVWDMEEKEGRDIQYSKSVVSYLDGVVVLHENKGKGIDHLKSLGTLGGFTVWDYNKYFQSGQIKLTEVNDFVPLLKQVLMENIDGAYIEIAVANYYLREVLKRPGGLVFDSDLPHTKGSYYLSTIKHPEIIQLFNNFLVSEESAIEMLQKKYKVGAFSQ